MGAIVGIDLGTTNSCVAVVKDGRPKVIEDERGYNILPSCVAMKGRGRFVVGHGAKALILTHPQDTLYAVKRLIGRKFHSAEVQESIKHVSYEVVEGEHGGVLLRMGDIELTPVESSSIILKAVREIAERALGEEVTDAVITVPANFTHAQRKASMEAGEKAGLNVLRLLNEPTAAALAYGFKKDINKRIAVFDLGGGTFDVSVLEVGEGVYEILGTAGNNFLGGEDFDYRIVNWLADYFTHMTGVDPRHDREALQRLKDAAERAKCELSFVDRTPILVPRLYGEHNLEVELSRDQLEAMVQDLVNESIKITDSALRAAGMSIEDLDEIILVGGMTRMPKIQETIKVFFGMNPCKGVHPEEVVAIGAAVHGYSLESETQSTLLLDVTPHSLGVDTAGGFFKSIVERNTTVPATETRTFTTVKDGQSEVKIVVRQGESKLANDNDFLGEFTLTGIRDAEKMVPRIDVTFRIDTNGILHVSAVDRDTGENQAIDIRDYIEQATGEEQKAVALARDVESPADLAAAAVAAANEEASKKEGLFGRLRKAAGFGGGKKDRPKDGGENVKETMEAPDITGIAARRADGDAVAERSRDLDAVAERSGDFDAVAERIDDEADAIAERAAAASQELQRRGPRVSAGDHSSVTETRDALPDALSMSDDGMIAVGDDGVVAAGGDPADEVFAAGDLDDDLAQDLRQAMSFTASKIGSVQDSGGLGGPAHETMKVEQYADPYAVSERGAAASRLDDLGSTAELDMGAGDLGEALGLSDLSGVPVSGQGVLDPYAVAPKSAGDAFGAGDLALGSDLGDIGGVDGLDPFALQSRSAAFGDDRTHPSAVHDMPDVARPDDDTMVRSTTRARVQKPSDTRKVQAQAVETAKAAAASQARSKKPAKLKIAYKKASTFKREYTRNLKRGGTFIKTKKPLEVGRDCVLHLTVPGIDDVLKLRGSVVWSSRGADLGPGQDEGMGIRYDPADTAGAKAVQGAIDRLA